MIGEKIRELRIKNQLSVQRLASNLGVSRTSVIRWEKNSMIPNSYNIQELANFFNISPAYFLENLNKELMDRNIIQEILSRIEKLEEMEKRRG